MRRTGTPTSRPCVHCQAALGEFTALWAPVTELAASPGACPPGPDRGGHEPDPDPGPRRVVHPADHRARRHPDRGADRGGPGPRQRPDGSRRPGRPRPQHPGHARRAHRDGHPRAPSSRTPPSGVLGRTAVVDLAVAVSYGDPVHEVARDIQRHVIATLRDHVGLQTVAVNVTVDDSSPTRTSKPKKPDLSARAAVYAEAAGPPRSLAASGHVRCRTTTTVGRGGWPRACSGPKERIPMMNRSGSPPRSG